MSLPVYGSLNLDTPSEASHLSPGRYPPPKDKGVQPSSPCGGSGRLPRMPGLALGGYGILGIGEFQMPALGVPWHGAQAVPATCDTGPIPRACTHPALAWPIPPSVSIQRALGEVSLTPLLPLTWGQAAPLRLCPACPAPGP